MLSDLSASFKDILLHSDGFWSTQPDPHNISFIQAKHFTLFTQSLIGLLHLVKAECSHLLPFSWVVVMFLMRLSMTPRYFLAPSQRNIYKMCTAVLLGPLVTNQRASTRKHTINIRVEMFFYRVRFDLSLPTCSLRVLFIDCVPPTPRPKRWLNLLWFEEKTYVC